MVADPRKIAPCSPRADDPSGLPMGERKDPRVVDQGVVEWDLCLKERRMQSHVWALPRFEHLQRMRAFD